MIDTALLHGFLFAAVACAALVLVLRHPMHVALAVVAAMLALAGVYAMVGAHAVAIFQVLIYVGAVMVFMVYVIMLLDVRDESLARRFSQWLLPATVAGTVLLACLGAGLWAGYAPFVAGEPVGLQAFAAALLNDYWLHFELVSILLVAAVVAALAVIGAGRRPRA